LRHPLDTSLAARHKSHDDEFAKRMNLEEYDRMYRLEDTYWWFVARRHLITSLMEHHFEPGGAIRILDVGCGTGAMLDELCRFGSVTGADFATAALCHCRERGARYPLARADIRRLPFASDTFDAVTAMDIIEHIDDDKAAVAEVHRVLKPGGLLFATVPAFPSLWSEHDEALHHYRRYTAPQFKDLLQRVGLAVPKASYTVTALFPPIWLYRQAAKQWRRGRDSSRKHADLVPFSPAVNSALTSLSEWESRLAQRVNFPFGVTVFAVAQKKDTSE
jgi:ubiquinone/menaquinone biosynthesis C-methylase UbiE